MNEILLLIIFILIYNVKLFQFYNQYYLIN